MDRQCLCAGSSVHSMYVPFRLNSRLGFSPRTLCTAKDTCPAHRHTKGDKGGHSNGAPLMGQQGEQGSWQPVECTTGQSPASTASVGDTLLMFLLAPSLASPQRTLKLGVRNEPQGLERDMRTAGGGRLLRHELQGQQDAVPLIHRLEGVPGEAGLLTRGGPTRNRPGQPWPGVVEAACTTLALTTATGGPKHLIPTPMSHLTRCEHEGCQVHGRDSVHRLPN